MDAIIPLASEEASFFDATFLYIAGGLLILLALVVAFLGMRKEDFPSSGQLKGLTGLAVVLVLCTGVGAVLSARYEQAERRAENQEAAKEADEQAEEKEQELAPLDEGEGSEPTPSGEAEAPAEDESGADGATLFTDTGCGGCHTLAAAGSSGTVGPDLDEVLPGQSVEEIHTSIVDPGASVAEGFADGVMPSNYGEELTELQLDVLATYLHESAGS